MALTTINYLGLTFRCDHYYIKRSRIVEKITFQNRTFYAKFERIDTPPDQTILSQHQKGEYTIALPLLQNGVTQHLVIEYKGEETIRFTHLCGYLLKRKKIERFGLFEGKSTQKIQCIIPIEPTSLEEAQLLLKELSNNLESHMLKGWKTLPSTHLPPQYNLITLPIRPIEAH